MGAHWVINVYIALSAPVMPILASYWPLPPEPRRIQPYRPRGSQKRIFGNPEKYRSPREQREKFNWKHSGMGWHSYRIGDLSLFQKRSFSSLFFFKPSLSFLLLG